MVLANEQHLTKRKIRIPPQWLENQHLDIMATNWVISGSPRLNYLLSPHYHHLVTNLLEQSIT